MQFRRVKRSQVSYGILAGLIAAAPAPAALARDQAAAATPVSAVTLDKIAVTPQKWPQTRQSAPLTVTVATSRSLNDNGILDLQDLPSVVSGLSVTSTQNSGQTTVRLRGIGSSGDNPGLASSVGVVVDGVMRPRVLTGFAGLDEIERIEVLKGPQDVLFGRNNTAGVINVVTARPSYETRAQGQVTIGDFGARALAASLTAGLDEMSAIRIFATARERDGFLNVNRGAGPRGEDEDADLAYYAGRGQLMLQPNSNLDLNFSFDYAKRNDNCCAAVTLVRGPSAATIDTLATDSGVAPVADPFARAAWSNRSTAQDIVDLGGAIQADWKNDWFGGSTLTSITSLRRWESVNGADLDFSSADLFHREPNDFDALTQFDTFDQELRLAGSSGALDWLVGVHYTQEHLDRNDGYRIEAGYESFLAVETLRRINPLLAASPTAPLFMSQASGRPFGTVFAGHSVQDVYEQDTSTLSFFTNNTWRALPNLDLTLGLRYTFENKELESRHSNPNGGLGCSAMAANPAQVVAALVARGLTVAQASANAPTVVAQACQPWTNFRHDGRATLQEIDDGDWSGTLKAAYRFSEQVSAYLSASRGYKAAGFNLERVQTNDATPGGVAGVLPVDNTSFESETVHAYELGLRTAWMGGNLLFNAAVFHQDYSDYQLSSFLGSSTVIRSVPELTTTGVDAEILLKAGGWTFQSGVTYADTTYGNDALAGPDLALLPGSRASFAPEWSVNGSVSYDWRVTDSLDMRATLGAQHVSDHHTGYDLDPQKLQDAYTLVNARVALSSRDDAWTLEVWAQNLTDEDYVQTSFNAPLQDGSVNGFLGAPRTIGVTLRAQY